MELQQLIGESKASLPGVLGRVGLFFLACAVMLAVFSPLASKLPGAWSLVVLGTVASLGVFALTVVFVRWEGLSIGDVGAALSHGSVLRFAVGFLVGLLLVALSAALQTGIGHLRWVRTPGTTFPLIAIALIGYVTLSCREELAFRGYPLQCLLRLLGPWGAQIIVALIFALEHWAGGWPWARAMLGAGVGSLLFGMAALATKGLAVPIGLHAAWNFGDSLIGQNYSNGLWNVVIEEGQAGRVQSVISISYVAVMALAFLAFWLLRRINLMHLAT